MRPDRKVDSKLGWTDRGLTRACSRS
jgi:hypothetical protein